MKIYTLIALTLVLMNCELMAGFPEKATVILGRSTDQSVTVNILAKQYMEFYIEYGQTSGTYPFRTEAFSSTYPEPAELIISGLEPNRAYYYRIQYREKKNDSYVADNEHFFHTQRARGSSFTFTIQADPHLYDKKGSDGLMAVTMMNQSEDSADFVIDLGDTFGDDHHPFEITDDEVKQLHLDYLPFFGMLCHSSPLFLCLGNHEGESGYYLLQSPPQNLAVYGTKWRQKYYPNPFPDGFYTGNSEEEPWGIGKPENYYAWEWGDALFVVLDVYRYYTANEKPKGWDWTIGAAQYSWLKNTLENSTAKNKFVFAHHVLGQGRGGVCDAVLNEWGGWKDDKKTKWEFDDYRPGWGKPIHQLMVDNGVNIFFQGHDHLFARESLDGVIYQEVPMPSDSTYLIGVTDNGDAYTDLILDGAGYLRVTVSDAGVKVDYIKSYLPKDETDSLKNGMLAYSYTVEPSTNVAEGENPRLDSPKFGITPDPATEYIDVTSSNVSSESQQVRIYNILGECVMECPIQSMYQSFRIDISGLTPGVYFLRIGGESRLYVKE